MRIKASTIGIIQRLLTENLATYAPQYAVAFVLMSIFAGCTAASAWLMKDVVNKIFVAQDELALVILPLVICSVFVAKGLAAYLQEISLARIGNRIVAETQRRLFCHILKMDAAFYQRQSSADLVTTITQRAGAVRDIMNILALGIGRDVFTLLSLIAVMLAQDVSMTLIAAIAGPLVAIGLRKLTRRVKKAAQSEFQSLATIVAATREAVQGIKVVKAFQLESVLEGRMLDATAAVERVNNKLTRIQSLTNPLIETIGGLAVAGVVAYAGWTTMARGQTPGEFFAFITALLLAADPLRRLSRMQLQLSAAAIGVETVYEILDAPTEDAAGSKLSALVVSKGEVRFEDVSFSYFSEQPVLRQLGFVAEAGKTTAIVGLSGAGKTTVLHLIQKLWLPDTGSIRIDGQRIDHVSTASLRSQISVVGQDTFLFEGSIRENIAAGCSDQSEDRIRWAAHAAHIDTFIEGLPQGYDTPVGELGAMLSGGQRQRISIARAFLKDAPILLLDEPTASLDSHAEQRIQMALRELVRGRTTIVIAHRFSTVIGAHRIIVLAEGRVTEAGTHGELVESGGVYAGLYHAQSLQAHVTTASVA